ncbi:MAG: oligoendopeptidase F [Lachnospiraceae bacterium]|nr:oligoendopeptidase F [Lachnospiraceae bacterium]
MAEQVKERNEIAEEYLWDLSSLFASDEDWEKGYAELEADLAKMSEFSGRLGDSAAVVADMYRTLYDLGARLEAVHGYSYQRRTEDTRAAKAQNMSTKADALYVRFMGAVSFVDPELLSLPEETLESYRKSPELAPYLHTFEDLLRQKPHTLSKEEEAIVAAFGDIRGAGGDVADMLMDADMTFDSIDNPEDPSKPIEVTHANYIQLQESTDRNIRKASFESLYRSYRKHINTFGATYLNTLKESTLMTNLRHYSSARAASLAAYNIPESVYDSLVETVHAYLPQMYRYLRLRKKLLGLDELHYYDIYTPITPDYNVSYTYDEAKELLLSSVAPLGEHYVETVRKGLATRWVDVFPNAGKRSGAYSIGSCKTTPHISMNFTGTLDSVSTLCHEMGHSMHTYLTHENQPPQYDDYSLFIAEVASTVNENLLAENLLAKTTDRTARLFLINNLLDGFRGTVFRQTMFAEFEQIAHQRAQNGESTSPEDLCNIYRDLIKLYFGDEIVIDDEVQYEWARIPHFYRPFYVYQYATGFSSAVALSEGILHEGEPAVKRYLEFLSLGNSVYPLEALAHGGVDLSTPAPVAKALDKFAKLLDEAEALVG